MSSERRVVRPFIGLEPFQKAMDAVRARIGEFDLEPGGRVTVPSNSFRHDPLVVLLTREGVDSQDLRDELIRATEAIDLDSSAVELVVVASTRRLKLSQLVHRSPLSDPDSVPASVILTRATVQALQTPFGGCDVEVALILATAIDGKPLRPRRLGTWLGRATFHVRTDLGGLGFTPRALTDEIRKELGLPLDTVRYVEIQPELVVEPATADESVTLYVDERVLSSLNQNPNTPWARSMQRQLFLDVVAAIVRDVSRVDNFPSLTLADIDDSLLLRVIDAAVKSGTKGSSRPTAPEREIEMERLREKPAHFLAKLEAACGMASDLRLALGGGDE